MRQIADFKVRLFPQNDLTDTPAIVESTEEGSKTEVVLTHESGTSISPPLVYSMPPRPWSMILSVMLISQAAWTEVVTQLAALTMKIGHVDG